MLTSRNSGKYLSEKYYQTRNVGFTDNRNLSDNDKEYADIEGAEGGGRFDSRTYVLQSVFEGRQYNITHKERRGDD